MKPWWYSLALLGHTASVGLGAFAGVAFLFGPQAGLVGGIVGAAANLIKQSADHGILVANQDTSTIDPK